MIISKSFEFFFVLGQQRELHILRFPSSKHLGRIWSLYEY